MNEIGLNTLLLSSIILILFEVFETFIFYVLILKKCKISSYQLVKIKKLNKALSNINSDNGYEK
jgi:hypothetical protein